MQQIATSIPDLLYQQLLDFSASHQTTVSQSVVEILSNYFSSLSEQGNLSVSMSQEEWNNLPDDEPDEILWDFLEPKKIPTSNKEHDFFDEPDEVLSDFLD